jgi:hypothetical protein
MQLQGSWERKDAGKPKQWAEYFPRKVVDDAIDTP